VAADILGSTEYHDDLVAGWYQSYLDRPANPTEIINEVAALNAGMTDQTAVANILGSPEFFG